MNFDKKLLEEGLLVDDLVDLRVTDLAVPTQRLEEEKEEEKRQQNIQIEMHLCKLMKYLSGFGLVSSVYYLTPDEKIKREGNTLSPCVFKESLFMECLYMGVRFQVYYALGEEGSPGNGFWLSFLDPTTADSDSNPLWSKGRCFGDGDEGRSYLTGYIIDQLAKVQQVLNKSSVLKQQNIETTQMVNKSFSDWLQESVEFRGKVRLYAVYPFSSEAGFGKQIAWMRDVDFDDLDEESSDIYQLSVFPADASQRNPSRNILPKGSVAFKQFIFTSAEELPPELKQQRYLQIKNCRREEVWVLRENKLERETIYISDPRYNVSVATEEIPHAMIIDLFG